MSDCFILLAAGKGKRFKSNTLKQFHILKGKPIINHSIEKAIKSKIFKEIIIVTNSNIKNLTVNRKSIMKKNKEILTKFIKESLLFETRMSNSNNYSSNISQEIRQITQKYVFDQEYLSVLLSWFNEGKTERLYDIKVKDITTGQTINIDYQLEGLFQKYIELYEKINRDAFGSRRQEQEVFYCKLGAVLFFNLNK